MLSKALELFSEPIRCPDKSLHKSNVRFGVKLDIAGCNQVLRFHLLEKIFVELS